MNQLGDFVSPTIFQLNPRGTSEPTDTWLQKPLPFNREIMEKLKFRGPPSHPNALNNKNTQALEGKAHRPH